MATEMFRVSLKKSAQGQILHANDSTHSRVAKSSGIACRILHEDLNFHSYKMVIIQAISYQDTVSRKNVCEVLLNALDNDDRNHVLMTNEASFHLRGNVISQNCRYWSTENPRNIHQKPLHSEKVIVWCGVTSFGENGPHFFEDEAGRAVTVNSSHYTEMLRTVLEPELQRISVETHNLWFQQDRATPHTVRTAIRVLNDMFPGCVISRRGNIEWPARSPHLNARDFFHWGYLKSKVCEKRPRTTVDLKQNIRDEMAAISPTMLQRVTQNFQKRLRE
jgi:hypothetical protein